MTGRPVRAIGATYATIVLDFGGMGELEFPWWHLKRGRDGGWWLIGDVIEVAA